MASTQDQISGARREMQPQQQMYQFKNHESQQSWEADTAHQNQIEILKSNLRLHSMRLTEMCTEYTMESQQADVAQSQEVKIVEQMKKDIRNLEEKLEQTMLKMASVNSNCQSLQAKVEGTVQFGKALAEQRPQLKNRVKEVKMVRDREQKAVEALEKEVQALHADYKALNLKFATNFTRLHNEVLKERETRIAAISQHVQKVSEINDSIKETQYLSCKQKAINADLQTTIDNEQKQMLALKNEMELDEIEFKREYALLKDEIDEIQSRNAKHQEGIDRGIAIKNEYQKLIPLMKELENDQKQSEELLITTKMEKLEIVNKLEVSTNVKMCAEQDIVKARGEIDESAARRQGLVNDRAIIVEKLQRMEEKLAEKTAEESSLKIDLENLNEVQMKIDNGKIELASNFNLVQSSIEKVNLDIQVDGEELARAKSQLADLEEKIKVTLGEINQVETDTEILVADRMDSERAVSETQSQVEQILAAKADLAQQEEAINMEIKKNNLEKTDMDRRIEEVELDIQSMMKESEVLEDKINAANSSTEILKSQILKLETDNGALQTMINSIKEEIKSTANKMDSARDDIENFTNDFKQSTLLLESALLAKEQVIAKNSAGKAELEIAKEMKQRKDTQIKIIEDELSINYAMIESNKNQAEILKQVRQELEREKEDKVKMYADMQRIIDEKTAATKETLKKVAALKEKRDADSKAIAMAEGDIVRNMAAEQEIVLKIKELEKSGVEARKQHEENLRVLAEEERIAAEGNRSLEELKVCLENSSEEHIQEKAKVEALDLKVKELEKEWAHRKLKNHAYPELVKKNEQLKQENFKLEKELQENLEAKTIRRSRVREESKQYSAQKAALTARLAAANKKIQELTAVSTNLPTTKTSRTTPTRKSPLMGEAGSSQGSLNLSITKASRTTPTRKSPLMGEAASSQASLNTSITKASRTTPTTKSPSRGDPSPSGSKSSAKNTPNLAGSTKEKSPGIQKRKAKSTLGKSPVLSGSHNIPSSFEAWNVRPVELWNVDAASTPITTHNSDFQGQSSPNEIPNSPATLTSSLKKKTKKNH